MGFQVNPFPTAIFSNNLTYGDFTFSDFTPHMKEFMDQWQKLNFSYDAIYSGFLADAGQIGIVLDAISRFAGKDTLVVVDPAMADDGKLYPVFTPDIVKEMKKLISAATVVTPNYTDACLLTDRPYDDKPVTTDALLSIAHDLTARGPKQVVITSVPSDKGTIRIACFDAKEGTYSDYKVKRIPFATCGTGDLFTSVVTGSLLQGKSFSDAVKKAASFLSYAIEYTYKDGSDYREGVQVEPCLAKLLEN